MSAGSNRRLREACEELQRLCARNSSLAVLALGDVERSIARLEELAARQPGARRPKPAAARTGAAGVPTSSATGRAGAGAAGSNRRSVELERNGSSSARNSRRSSVGGSGGASSRPASTVVVDNWASETPTSVRRPPALGLGQADPVVQHHIDEEPTPRRAPDVGYDEDAAVAYPDARQREYLRHHDLNESLPDPSPSPDSLQRSEVLRHHSLNESLPETVQSPDRSSRKEHLQHKGLLESDGPGDGVFSQTYPLNPGTGSPRGDGNYSRFRYSDASPEQQSALQVKFMKQQQYRRELEEQMRQREEEHKRQQASTRTRYV